MRRRELLVAGGASLATVPLREVGAQTGRLPRLGILAGRINPSLTGFEDGMRDLGFVDGRNISVERRIADGGNEQARAMAAELVALGPDAIFVTAVQATAAIRQATTTIPVVFAILADPIALGWETSFARPSRNLTGIAGVDTGEIAGKRIELLLAAVPQARRIGMLYTPGLAGAELAVRGTESAARTLGVELRVIAVMAGAGPERAFEELRAWGADGLIVAQSSVLATQPLQGRIVALAHAARLPAIYGEPDWVEIGALMTYVPDAYDMGRRSAALVERLLRGAKPADVPIERPARILLRINLGAARAIGLTLPPTLLARADETID